MNNQTATLIFIISLTSACTGGVVIRNGAPVANAVVSFHTSPCREDAGMVLPATDANGQFSSNPFSATSSGIDYTKKVPTGHLYVKLATPNGTYWRTLDHAYDQSCSVTYNGAPNSAPCRGYIFETSLQYGSGGAMSFDSTYNAFRLVFTPYDTAGTSAEIRSAVAALRITSNLGSRLKCTPLVD